MKKNLLITIALTLLLSLTAIAQEFTDGPEGKAQQKRPNIIQELNLEQSQIQQIRRIYGMRGPQMREAQKRLREANRALDDAIYDQETGDAQIESLMKEVQSAQMDVIRLRTQTETDVRKVLTREQLIKFRELRRKFSQNKGGRMPGPPPLKPGMNQPGNPPRDVLNNPNRPARRIFNRRQIRNPQ